MLVTPTYREVFTLVPGFRVMAVSMYGLEIDVAGISLFPVDMINLKLVPMWEEQSTIGTAPLLPFEQGGQSGTDHWIPSLSLTPVHPIPIVRTPIARDLGVPQTRSVTMGGERRLTRTGGRCGKHPSGLPTGPVSVVYPSS
jgi:hypothetical protein